MVSLHFGSGSFVPGFSASAKQLAPNYKGGEFKSVSARTDGNVRNDDDAPTCTSFVVYATNLMWTASDLVFSGQLQKHPKLKFMLAEGGIGWFPYIRERMDQVWSRHRYYQPIDFDTRPSDRAIAVNLRAPMVLSRLLGAGMASRGRGLSCWSPRSWPCCPPRA